jgi:hypothetical protein
MPLPSNLVPFQGVPGNMPGDTSVPPDGALQAAPTPVVRDQAKLRALGGRLMSEFEHYEKDRKLSELKWMRNYRQFIGEYDPEVQQKLDRNRSMTYPRITRVKCISMLSRLMNLLFPSSEKNYTIEPSPVPNLAMDRLQTVLQQVKQQAQQGNTPITSDLVEAAIRDEARKDAKALEMDIEDQLAEIGGSRNLPYVALCRKVALSAIIYGAGILKGPFVRKQKQRTWQVTDASTVMTPNGPETTPADVTAQEIEVFRPQFEFVPIWDYYPDMSAKYPHQMEGQFHRLVMSRQQVRDLADQPTFYSEVIMKYLTDHRNGNYKERTYERELRTLGTKLNVNPNDGRKYEIYVWDGMLEGRYLKDAGVEVPDNTSDDMVEASVWILDGNVIRAELSPWRELETEERIKLYHIFIFEEDDSQLLGNSLADIMRDSQMGISASTRMLMDNASIVCAPNLEVNTDLLDPAQDMQAIQPYKIWYREGTGADSQYDAVRVVKIDSHIEELKEVIQLFREFADTETFINPATGGDMQKGPSEPFRTAAGASMLRGDAALPFKDVVRNFDTFTISVMNALLVFNKHFNASDAAKGDNQIIARGASSLIAKEVRGMAYDMLATTLQPEEKVYIDWQKLLKDRLAVRDVSPSDVMVDDDTSKQRQQAEEQKQAQQEQQMRDLMQAEIRKLLADAVKSLTQADKNTSAGEVATYNAVLKGLQDGISPTDVDAARASSRSNAPPLQQPGGAGTGGTPPNGGVPPGVMPGQAGVGYGGNGAEAAGGM